MGTADLPNPRSALYRVVIFAKSLGLFWLFERRSGQFRYYVVGLFVVYTHLFILEYQQHADKVFLQPLIKCNVIISLLQVQHIAFTLKFKCNLII